MPGRHTPKVECIGCSHNKRKTGGQLQVHRLLLNHRLMMQSNVWEFTNKVALQEIDIMRIEDEVVRDLPCGSMAMLKNGLELVRNKAGWIAPSLHIELLPFAREANQASVNSFIHPRVFHP